MTAIESTEGDLTEGGGGRRSWLMIGAGVGAAALIGGGAVAAAQFLGGAGDRPDSVLPHDAAAYVQMDLDPSAGQKVAAVRFFQGLDPELRERLDRGEWREWVWEELSRNGEVPQDVSFEEDIEPWLGDRAGMAVLPTGAGEEPVVAVAVQVKDGDAALDFLDGMTAQGEQDVAYYLDSDYVVFSQKDTLETVRAAASAGTLDGNEAYTSDMEDLGEAGIMAAWGDLGGLSGIDPAVLNPALGQTQAELGVGADDAVVTGRFAATVRLSPDAIEVTGIGRAAEGFTWPAGDGAGLVGDLPADTAVALSVENGAAMVLEVWDQYRQTHPEELQSASDEAARMGFSLPEDLAVILGDSMALAVGPAIVDAVGDVGPTDPTVPALPLGYRVTTDTDRVQALLNENGLGAGILVLREDDGTLTVGTDQAYVDALAEGTGDTLGSTDLFSAAVADADTAQAVLFVDVAPFERYYLPQVSDDEVNAALEQLAAVGASSVVEGEGDTRFTLRLVADQE